MAKTPPIVLCGSLSRYPVGLGAAMHNAAYRARGLSFTYVPFALEEDLEGALSAMRVLGIRGYGISMPFKLRIIPLLDRLDPLAERIGAVNTVVNDADELVGHNTDAPGAVRALEEGLGILAGKAIGVIGAGGAARAVAHGLVSAGAELVIMNRSADKADALARELGARSALLGAPPSGLDALVNASSATMAEYGGESPVPETCLAPVVMDIVYKPIETTLVQAARRAGLVAIHGGRMLLHQAARQFELYTGVEAPLAEMGAALEAAIPGSAKVA